MSIKSAERFIDNVVEGYKEQSCEIRESVEDFVEEAGALHATVIGIALTGVAAILCISVATLEVARAIRNQPDE